MNNEIEWNKPITHLSRREIVALLIGEVVCGFVMGFAACQILTSFGFL